MDSFLGQIAHRIATDHPKDTDRVLVVMNNRRSVRYFKKQYESLGHASFLPQVTTIDDLVAQLGGLEIVPNEFLLFELYSIHEEIGGTDRKYQTFEEFISFGDLMLGDFSELDQYCVDAHQLFSHLHAVKEIGEWSIDDASLNDFQRRYLEFYRSLYTYYERLHTRLLAQGKAYGGMAYREVAEHIGEHADRCQWDHIYFIGFNALSRCEQRIIGEYVRRGIGHLLTDHDPYFLEDNQEAGYFLRRHMEEFPELRPTGTSLFGEGKKRITIVECPENILQCKYTGQLLSQHPELLTSKQLESTAVVLADESLLIPTLNALPDSAEGYNVNISMGYAYTDSVIHALMLKLLSLYRQQNAKGYYHSDLVEVLGDRYIGSLAGVDNLRKKTERFIESGSRIRCTAAQLKEFLASDRLAYLFPDTTPTPQECVSTLRHLLADILAADLLERNKKERQAAASLAEVLDNLDALMSRYNYIGNIETLEKIYSRIAQRHSIALIGEPLSGLQILGMLETRNLDFHRVILLSANEGVLPAGNKGNTLIPYDLKGIYGLPTYVEKDSVYAHHFYRLLMRAEEVYLLFSSESESMGKGEESRFIRQVERELAPKYGIEVRRLTVNSDSHLQKALPPDRKEKSPRVMQRLKEMAEHGLSPTSFIDYIECPLKYYYSRVLKIGEKRAVDEELDASQLGSCIHTVLEHIHGKALNRPLTADELKEALKNLTALMDEQFDELYHNGRNSEGRNRFLYSVAESQLKHLLQNEITLIEQGHRIEIVGVEEKIDGYTVFTAADGTAVKIKGTVDRIDRLDGRLRILDYKTGSLKDAEIAFSDKHDAMPGKWLQLMWYALLYHRRHPDTKEILSGIYPLRNLRSDVKTARWESAEWDDAETITPEKLERFEAMLAEKTAELMDPQTPFSPTPGKDACAFCPVKNFCPQAAK